MIGILAISLVLAAAPKVIISGDSKDDVEISVNPSIEIKPAVFDLAKEKAALRDLGQVGADGMTKQGLETCKAMKQPDAVCALLVVKVKSVYVAALYKPGQAGLVILRYENGVELGLFFLRQSDGRWGIAPEEFR